MDRTRMGWFPVRVGWLGVVCAVLMAFAPATKAASAPSVGTASIRLMPLGDSITQGQGGHGPSYRYHLWNRLTTVGYPVDFVGSMNQPFVAWRLGMPRQPQAFSPSVLPLPFDDFDPDHEGHAGWKAEDLLANIDAWMRAYRPQIVLLHIGTNDLASNQSVASTVAEIGQLIDHMRAINPWVKVAVAQIIPCGSSLCPTAVWADFNARLPTLIAAKNTAASPLVVVDQNSGFDLATDSYDGVHPNAAGDLKIARRWYPAVVALLGPALLSDDAHSIDDAEDGFAYSGAWSACTTGCDPNSAGIYSGTVTSSSAPNSTAEISFTVGLSGSAVQVYLVKNARAGVAAVSVDGAEEQAIDLFARSDFGYAHLWQSPPLLAGPHRLRVRVTGNKNAASSGAAVSIDRITLLPTLPASFTQAIYLPLAVMPQ